MLIVAIGRFKRLALIQLCLYGSSRFRNLPVPGGMDEVCRARDTRLGRERRATSP